jgi:DNA-binding protein HU-beta
MAKGMTKTQLVRALAEKMELTNKQTTSFLEVLADTAVKETKKNGEFTIPGIGKLVKAERKARIGRNPQTGEAIKIKAKTVVKFRIAKVAKDAIAPVKK